MQTTPLNTQLNLGAASAINATSAAQRSNAANASGDAGQFGAMLSNEMAQAHAPTPAPQAPAAPKHDAAKPAQAEQPAQAEDAPAAPAPNATQDSAKAGAKPAEAGSKTGDDDASKPQTAGTAQQNADPASAMLALMASLQQPAAKPGAASMAQSFDALGGNAARGKRTDSGQLAALQAAMKSVSKDGADARTGAASVKSATQAADGAAFAIDDKAGAPGANAADASAALLGAGVKAEPKPQLDATELSLQQARDAAQQAAQQDPTMLAGAAVAQVQPAALEAAQAAAASEQLSAQVGTDAWENQVGQKVVYMLGSDEQTASLTLNPPDLGPMQVVLSVSNDQTNVTFSSNQQEVRQALENALPRLREMMSDSGIALGNATVNAGMPDGRQPQQQSARGSNGGASGSRGRADGIAAGADAPARTVTRIVRGDNGMVDTFA